MVSIHSIFLLQGDVGDFRRVLILAVALIIAAVVVAVATVVVAVAVATPVTLLFTPVGVRPGTRHREGEGLRSCAVVARARGRGAAPGFAFLGVFLCRGQSVFGAIRSRFEFGERHLVNV